MNKIAKILSVVLSAVLALSVSVVTLVSAFAATAPVLSLNIVEDNDESVVLEVRLDKGCFNAIDIQVKGISEKIGACTSAYETDEFLDYIRTIKREGGQGSSASYANTGKLSAALTIPYDTENGSVMEYTFAKNSADKVTNEDLSLVVTSCKNPDGDVTALTVNNLPTVDDAEPEEDVTPEDDAESEEDVTPEDDAEPEEVVTPEDDAEPEEVVTPEDDAEPEEDVNPEDDAEPEEDATPEDDAEPEEDITPEDDAETEEDIAPVDDEESPIVISPVDGGEADTTTTCVAENKASEATSGNDVAKNDSSVITTDGNSVNPNTGDGFTTTAAFASLLAISAAVVVALRKKED